MKKTQKKDKTQLLLRIYDSTAGFLSYSAIFSLVMNLFCLVNRNPARPLSALGFTTNAWLNDIILSSTLSRNLQDVLSIGSVILTAAIFFILYAFAKREHFWALLLGSLLYVVDFILIAPYYHHVEAAADRLTNLIVIHSIFSALMIVSIISYSLIYKLQTTEKTKLQESEQADA